MINDPDLRSRFAELRQAEQHHVGEFQAFLRRMSPRTGRVRTIPWFAISAALTILIAVIAFSVRPSGRRELTCPQVSITEWKSSTDFLLRTPGEEILQTVPRFGDWPRYNAAPGGNSKPLPTHKKDVTKLFAEEHLS
jgi:hypothetical protein